MVSITIPSSWSLPHVQIRFVVKQIQLWKDLRRRIKTTCSEPLEPKSKPTSLNKGLHMQMKRGLITFWMLYVDFSYL